MTILKNTLDRLISRFGRQRGDIAKLQALVHQLEAQVDQLRAHVGSTTWEKDIVLRELLQTRIELARQDALKDAPPSEMRH